MDAFFALSFGCKSCILSLVVNTELNTAFIKGLIALQALCS